MNFCKEMRPKIVKDDPTLSFGDVGKALGASWGKLTDAQKLKVLAVSSCRTSFSVHLHKTPFSNTIFYSTRACCEMCRMLLRRWARMYALEACSRLTVGPAS